MTGRVLTPAMLAEWDADQSVRGYFVELGTATPLRLNTLPGAVLWHGHTWGQAPGQLDVEPFADASNGEANLGLTLSGLDPATAALVLNGEHDGRRCTVWSFALDRETAQVIADPYLLWRGLFMDGSEYRERRGAGGEGTATIKLRSVSRLGAFRQARGARANQVGHQSAIPAARAASDTLCARTAQSTRVLYWGTPVPQGAIPSGGGTPGSTVTGRRNYAR